MDYKYYCYRHIRLDTNEPFYIGIGTTEQGICYNLKGFISQRYIIENL